MTNNYIRWFEDITLDDIASVGGKNASLGEMYRELTSHGVKVPHGFAITASAYRSLLAQPGVNKALHEAMDKLNADDMHDLAQRGARAREIIYNAPLGDKLITQILLAYAALKSEYTSELSLAVRSSATAEDLPTASFAGQQDTYLNISGDNELLEACKRCFASLFTDRAIHYRIDQGFDHFDVALSIGVMKMVRSDIAASGVMFSMDTETGFNDVVFITGAYGLGENVVQGTVEPDEFYVHKPTFNQGHRMVLHRHLGGKKIQMVYTEEEAAASSTYNIPTPEADQARFCISDAEVLTLTDYALKVESHYSQKIGHNRPMDMEWAKDGIDGQLYMVQARPETVNSQRTKNVLEVFQLDSEGEILITGNAVGARIATGTIHVIADAAHMSEFQAGEILVADTTSPDWEPVMKIASAIVTNRGGRTCHAAIIARELGIPAIVGTDNATTTLINKDKATVSCAEGVTGKVYRGEIPFHVTQTDLAELARPATEIMINIGNPDIAFKTAQLPNDGVGLARMEFIITQAIKAHPMALLHPERITDTSVRDKITALTQGYKDGADFFVSRLAEGVGTIAAAFYPKPVVLRMSDFKSNEYASLLGGHDFEPTEANPMIGFRGASRYAHPAYADGFRLECQAMKRVREDMGLNNVILMLPFVRRVAEADAVLAKMAEFGLKRGENGLQIYAMCEVPNNVILIDQFAKRFDGFSIGSNDLTQLTLGVDRDSEIVAFDYDERDDGVKAMIELAVKGCRRNNIHSGLCGQAPSDYPEMAEFLVNLGIDSISLNPDSVLATTRRILALEAQLGRAPRALPGELS
jgi:pyruvate,water dikinase